MKTVRISEEAIDELKRRYPNATSNQAIRLELGIPTKLQARRKRATRFKQVLRILFRGKR